jgi:hypothetical protein
MIGLSKCCSLAQRQAEYMHAGYRVSVLLKLLRMLGGVAQESAGRMQMQRFCWLVWELLVPALLLLWQSGMVLASIMIVARRTNCGDNGCPKVASVWKAVAWMTWNGSPVALAVACSGIFALRRGGCIRRRLNALRLYSVCQQG